MPQTDTLSVLIPAAALLIGWTVTLGTALAAWRGWLRLRWAQHRRVSRAATQQPPTTAAMIDLADLRERIRKLEAIAAGINP